VKVLNHFLMALVSKLYLFLSQFCRVFLWDFQRNKLIKLLLLDGLNLSSFILYLLSHLSTLFQVVQSVLLGLLIILNDLSSQLQRMFLQHFLLLFLYFPFLFLNFFLFLDNSHELISLLLRLFSQSSFSIHELLLSGIL